MLRTVSSFCTLRRNAGEDFPLPTIVRAIFPRATLRRKLAIEEAPFAILAPGRRPLLDFSQRGIAIGPLWLEDIRDLLRSPLFSSSFPSLIETARSPTC